MSETSFGLSSSHLDTCHIRFIDNEEEDPKSLRDQVLNSRNGSIYAMPGVCLHEDAKLEEVLEMLPQQKGAQSASEKGQVKLTFLLSPAKAPSKSNNEITIRCVAEETIGRRMSQGENVEMVICLNSVRVGELTDMLVQILRLPIIEETSNNVYYLKTLNWAGDTDAILNDVSLLCLDVPLKHNDLLVLCQGRIVPPDHCRINIWRHGSQQRSVIIEA